MSMQFPKMNLYALNYCPIVDTFDNAISFDFFKLVLSFVNLKFLSKLSTFYTTSSVVQQDWTSFVYIGREPCSKRFQLGLLAEPN